MSECALGFPRVCGELQQLPSWGRAWTRPPSCKGYMARMQEGYSGEKSGEIDRLTRPNQGTAGLGQEKCGAVDEGVGFGVEEGESKSAGEAKLRKRVAQCGARGSLRSDDGEDQGLQIGSRLADVLVSNHSVGVRAIVRSAPPPG